MVEGVILSDSELLVDVDEDEYQEWEQGEINDFMEEEDVVVQDQESGDDDRGDEGRENKDEAKEKAPKKKQARPGPLAIGGSMKMRAVQNLLSPRNKNAAKTSAKAGDKGVVAPKKASMKPKTSE